MGGPLVPPVTMSMGLKLAKKTMDLDLVGIILHPTPTVFDSAGNESVAYYVDCGYIELPADGSEVEPPTVSADGEINMVYVKNLSTTGHVVVNITDWAGIEMMHAIPPTGFLVLYFGGVPGYQNFPLHHLLLSCPDDDHSSVEYGILKAEAQEEPQA